MFNDDSKSYTEMVSSIKNAKTVYRNARNFPSGASNPHEGESPSESQRARLP